ncbi:MAG: hypothetical protein LC790_19105, partial [Actinobacteria bacterium]|nr:hypothetical protein [Actinomycetota bacterium]
MPNAEPVRPARDEPGADLLGLLADALLGRVEELISERLDGPAGSRVLHAPTLELRSLRDHHVPAILEH